MRKLFAVLMLAVAALLPAKAQAQFQNPYTAYAGDLCYLMDTREERDNCYLEAQDVTFTVPLYDEDGVTYMGELEVMASIPIHWATYWAHMAAYKCVEKLSFGVCAMVAVEGVVYGALVLIWL